MPIGKASWRQFSGGVWVAGPRENVPSGNLRRGLGIYPIRSQGSILSASGNTLREGPNGDGVVRSITQFVGHCIVARGTALTADGGAFPSAWNSGGGIPAFNGQRVEFLELPATFLSTSPNIAADLSGGPSANTDFLFASGAGPAYKIDAAGGGTYWGIDAPSSTFVNSVSVAANAYNVTTSKPINFCDSLVNRQGAGPSGFATAIDTNRFVPDAAGNASLRLDCPRDGETMSTFSFAPSVYSPVDLTTFTSGTASTDEDYIQFWVHIARPVNITSINVKFFVQPAGIFTQTLYNQDPNAAQVNTAPYTSYYHTELTVQVVKEKRRKQLLGLGDFIPFGPENKATKRYLAQHPPDKGPDLDALQFLNPRTIAVSRNTWTRVTIPKGLFDRAGQAGTTGNTWANVVGMQLSVETNKSGNTSVWFDDIELQGGVGTRGDYLYTFTFRNDNTGARSNPPYTRATDGTITLVTTPVVTLDRQSATLTFPGPLAANQFRGGTLGASAVIDTQVTHVEIWRTIGNGIVGKPGSGESNALFNAPPTIEMFLVDKVAVGTSTYTDFTADYPGMHSLGGAKFLNSDQEMQFDNQPPWTVNQTIGSARSTTMGQAVYHPPTGRVFYLDSTFPTRVFCSPPGRPESVASFLEPVTKDDPIQRLVVWNDNLYIVSNRRIQQLNGTDPPFTTTPLAGVPGTAYPYCVTPLPSGIFYIAQDGARLCDGQTSNIVAQDALGPIFRGSATEGLNPFQQLTVAGFPAGMAAYVRDEVMLTDGAGVVLCWSPATDAWRVLPLKNVTAIFSPTIGTTVNPMGVIWAGVNDSGLGLGTIYNFDGTANGEQGGIVGEPTTFAMAAADVGQFQAQTPSVFVSGENQGIVMLLYIEADTQGVPITPTLRLDTTDLTLPTISSVGKTRFEFNINRPANIAAVVFSANLTSLTTRIEISSIEIQVYESAGE